MANGRKNRYQPILDRPQTIGSAFLTGFAGSEPAFARGYMQGDQILRQQEQDAQQAMQLKMQLGQQVEGINISPQEFQSAGMEPPSRGSVPIKPNWMIQEDSDIRKEKRLDRKSTDRLKKMGEVAQFIQSNPGADKLAAAVEFGMNENEYASLEQIVKISNDENLEKEARKELLEKFSSKEGINIEGDPGWVVNFALRNMGAESTQKYLIPLLSQMVAQNRDELSDKRVMAAAKLNFTGSLVGKGFSGESANALMNSVINQTPMEKEDSDRLKAEAQLSSMSDENKTATVNTAEAWVAAAKKKGVELDMYDAINMVVLGSKEASPEAMWTKFYLAKLTYSDDEEATKVADAGMSAIQKRRDEGMFSKTTKPNTSPAEDPKVREEADQWKKSEFPGVK